MGVWESEKTRLRPVEGYQYLPQWSMFVGGQQDKAGPNHLGKRYRPRPRVDDGIRGGGRHRNALTRGGPQSRPTRRIELLHDRLDISRRLIGSDTAAHAYDGYPLEACGLLIGRGEKVEGPADLVGALRRGLGAAGFRCFGGENAPYIWVKTPDGLSSWQLFDRMLRTGTLIIESASQDPLEFDDIPQIEQVHSLLYHEVFDTLGSEESPS